MPEETSLSARSGGNLRAAIHEDIRNRIHRGELGPNDRLVDVEIAASLGVSRMPVREALLQLTHEGYLVGTTRGFMLPRLTPADVADIFEVRRCLEPRAAAHAARSLDADGLRRLAAALDDAERAVATVDADLLFQANVAFRSSWLEAVDNKRLSSAIARFADHVQVVRFGTLSHPPTQVIVLAGMSKLYAAFERRDSMAAFDHMTTFIKDAEDRFVALAQTMENSEAGSPRTMRKGQAQP